MRNLFFSIVIPLFNKESFIKRTIKTVLRQTLNSFEIIVVDDGSTDNSLKIIKQFKDKRIVIVEQKNQGVSAARNTGILKSKADYIAFLDADDEWLPDFLATIQNLIYKFPHAKAFSTSRTLINSKGEHLDIIYAHLPAPPWQGVIDNLFRVFVKENSPVSSSSICVNKEVFNKIGLFPLGIKRGEDLDMWFRIFLNYNIAFSTDNKALIHNDIKGGSFALAKSSTINIYTPIMLEKKIKNNEIPIRFIKDVKKTITKLMYFEADVCLHHKDYTTTLNYILDEKFNYNYSLKIKMFLKLVYFRIKNILK